MSAEFDLHALDKKEIRQQVFEQLLSQITTGKWKRERRFRQRMS